jgi:hypothetical protein
MKPLKRIEKIRRTKKKCWHFVKGKQIDGLPGGLSGDVSGINGDVSGINGDVTGISGNFDQIPLSDRADKPNVNDWIEG